MRKAIGSALLFLSACGQGAPTTPSVPALPAPIARDAVRLSLHEVVAGLARPVGIEDAGDGSGRLYVIEQDGRIRELRDGRLQATPYLDLSQVGECDLGGGLGRRRLGFTSSAAGNERGLLGLAFHPRFADNGLVFVDFTDGQGDTVVARFRRSADGGRLDPGSCLVILRVDQDFANHNGGGIAFGPDGHLYVGMGDGGSGNDPCNRASTSAPAQLRNDGPCAPDEDFLASGGNAGSRALLGKLLRLDVDHATPAGARGLCAARGDGSAEYAAPRDNAANGGAREVCAETWTLGWRNPWRFAFDAGNGDLYVGDVGQNTVEEITRIPSGTPAGGHYGWRGCEGDRDNEGGHCQGTLPPLLVYRHERGRCSVTGGVLYRGPEVGLQGRYLFGDYCSGEIFVADPATGRFAPAAIDPPVDLAFGITSFGTDAQGRAYVVFHGLRAERGGAVYEIRSGR